MAVQSKGRVQSEVVAVERGRAEIKFEVDPRLPLSIAIGPESASDEDIFHLQTLTATVSPVQWRSPTLSVDYSNAVTAPQTAVRPVWNGGAMRLHINDASKVFPKTCCYLIELTVWKRNIVNCDGHLTYYNRMHYTFTVTV